MRRCSHKLAAQTAMRTVCHIGAFFLLAAVSASAQDNPEATADACRSVHLSYQSVPNGSAFYNEVKVEQSARGTYFCVCGFSRGYYGIQELYDGKKVLLFSVWDPGDQNDQNSVDESQRVRLLHKDPAIRVGRFGNEGTGGQSFLDLDWKIGETYRVAVASRRNGKRTEYASFLYHPIERTWKHLVTFSTLTEDKSLRGYYAFIEDFRRNRVSATISRRAVFPNAWVREIDGTWQAAVDAKFTGDSTPTTNINAGLADDQFYLATGGQLKNDDTPLWGKIKRTAVPKADAFPQDVEAVIAEWLNSPLK